MKLPMRDEERLSSREQPPLLSRGDGLFSVQQPAPADLDLDKDEFVTTLHDQIQFPGRAAPLFSQAGVTSFLELPARMALSSVTKSLARCPHYDERSHKATGEKHRRWWTLGPCSASRALCNGEQYPLWSSKP